MSAMTSSGARLAAGAFGVEQRPQHLLPFEHADVGLEVDVVGLHMV
jgi:hypothetical protein